MEHICDKESKRNKLGKDGTCVPTVMLNSLMLHMSTCMYILYVQCTGDDVLTGPLRSSLEEVRGRQKKYLMEAERYIHECNIFNISTVSVYFIRYYVILGI